MDASRPAKWGPPWALLAMIALIVPIERWVARPGHFDSDMAVSWRMKAQAAAQTAPRCDVLCFGDSLIEFGVHTPLLEERIGGRAYNLAIHAGTPPASYLLLRQALDAGARPRAVVVDFSPTQVVFRPGYETIRHRAWPELAGFRDAFALSRDLEDRDFVPSFALRRLLPSYLARNEASAAIKRYFRGGEDLLPSTTWRNLVANRGAFVMKSEPREADENPIQLDLTETRHDPRRLAYIDRFLGLAAARGIPVFWVVTPVSPEYQALADDSDGGLAYGEFVRRTAARFPNVVVLDARRAGYGPGQFIDPIHLNGDGAAALTEAVADAILRPMPAPDARLVAIPRYGPQPSRKHLEDIHESKAYLTRLWNGLDARSR